MKQRISYMKPYEQSACKYGKDRERDAQALFDMIIKRAERNPVEFAKRLLETMVFNSSKKHRVTITAHACAYRELHLHCDNWKCPKLQFGTKCSIQSHSLLPDAVTEEVEALRAQDAQKK